MVIKRSTKRLIKTSLFVIGIMLIVGVFITQQFVFIDTSYHGTVKCDKIQGCSNNDISTCEAQIDNIQREGWECEPCNVWCSNTQEMRRLSDDYQNECQNFYGGGAIVEAKAICTLTQPKSKDKTVCSDGTKHVFNTGTGWPTEKEFDEWDVYWMNEIDQLEEERKDNCKSDEICIQVDSKNAKCVDKENEDERFNPKDRLGCYAYGGRWEVWWFNSDNEISIREDVCEFECENGKCQAPEIPDSVSDDISYLDDDDTRTDCTYGPCESDVTLTCSSGTVITAYICENGCAQPTTNSCPEGQGGGIDKLTGGVISRCAIYQVEKDGECKTKFDKIFTTEGIKSFYSDNKNAVIISIGIILVLAALFAPIGGKRKRGGGLL